ncbi:hypothetical protein LTR56_001626 [Elasticomyces elasticus]|nr:hypothetical protein LTR56_001626 [Elasticomyces elasticus]KAK3667322.1 hypothetical protein LTR22_001838 [Elasticomyces elasticus]KAK4932598.1 hypothetical protein LTR49_001022 [Elasticomyces elasticus]KAK5769620.1 hypothetical protein LTS12_000070 [Elasticomyces elasticus]
MPPTREEKRWIREAVAGMSDEEYIRYMVESESVENSSEKTIPAINWDRVYEDCTESIRTTVKEEAGVDDNELSLYDIPECMPREALLSMPPELTELVAAFLPPPDLLSVRATCRDLEFKTRRLFINANFTSKTFLLPDARSMQALVDISKHRVFKTALKHITLVPWQLRGIKDHQKMRIASAEARQMTAREIRAMRRETGFDHARIVAAQQRYFAASEWKTPLDEALANLAEVGKSVSVELTAELPRPPAACGSRRLTQIVGYSDSLVCHPSLHLDCPEVRVLRTVLSSGCRVRKFAITGFRNLLLDSFADPALVEFDRFSPTLAGRRTYNALAFIQKLDLTLCKYKDDPVAFVDFINQAKELRQLRLNREDCRDGAFTRHLLRNVELPKLVTFHVPKSLVLESDIVSFVKRHKSSLERVSVRAVCIRVFDAAASLVRCMLLPANKVYADLLMRDNISLLSWNVAGKEYARPANRVGQ